MNEKDSKAIHELFSEFHCSDNLGMVKSKLVNYVAAVRQEERRAAFPPPRKLYSELIHIAAELVRADGFLSPCEEDLEPKLGRAGILQTARTQEERLKDWAMRVRRVADQLSLPAASPVPEQKCKCGLSKDDPIHSFSTEWQQMHKFTPAATPTTAVERASFQDRVQPWMLTCFGAEIAADKVERNHRFLEEALELVQSCGATREAAHQLVDYTFNRPADPPQREVGGVMVTLAALCLAQGFDMHECGEAELTRVWGKIETIRAKQAAKPKHSPLPEHVPAPSSPASVRAVTPVTPPSDVARKAAEEIREWLGIGGLVDGEGLNEVAAIIERHVSAVPVVEGDDATRLRWLLTQIISDLPAKRDWLDPGLEREARELTGIKSISSADAV